MKPAAARAAGPEHLHIVEPVPLGHGPLWLGYLLDAMLPCLQRVTVTYPHLAAYDFLRDRQVALGDRLQLRPVEWRDDKRSWPDTLMADDVDADATLLTYADLVLKKYRGDLRDRLATPIWGIWFLPGRRHAMQRLDLRRLYSGQARARHREQQLLRHVPNWLSGIFVLDSLLQQRISPRSGLQVEVLPDPWPTRPTVDQAAARQRLGLPAERKIFLHFGVDNPRKGLSDTTMAWRGLDASSDALLVRAGLTRENEAAALEALVDDGQALLRNERIADADVDWYFRAADWILLPYRQHEGSSGLLTAAAAAKRPVIASDYGVLGQRTREAGLGLVYPHGSVTGLTGAIDTALERPIDEFAGALAAYADSHDMAHFHAGIRDALNLTPRQAECSQNQA